MKKFTTQEIIDMGAQLYDNSSFTRTQIIAWLNALLEAGCAEFNIRAVADLIF